jgi:hypothetical protein
MSWPTDPKRLQVVDRIVEVLKNVGAGASYFYTARDVTKRLVHWREVTEFPTYSVFIDSGGTLKDGLGRWKSSEFHVNVKGIVDDEGEGSVAKVIRCIRDVRYAIETDMRSTATGSLGNLCAALFIEEEAETDNGYLSIEGRGFFDQRIKVVIAGTIDTL